MSERHKFMGRLEEKKIEAEKLKLKLEGLRDSIRDHLDPFDDVEELKLDVMAVQALEAADLQMKLQALREEIRAIKKVLGR